MDNNIILLIVEGEVREVEILNRVKEKFFNKDNIHFIHLSFNNNIYVIYQKMKEDDFDTDLIEVIKENTTDVKVLEKIKNINRNDISETYLFFDYDGHNNNLKTSNRDIDVIKEMLEIFNNETELGKLYISYPMIESTFDFTNECRAFTNCFINIKDINNYKYDCSLNNKHMVIDQYTHENWRELLNNYILRLQCLLKLDAPIDYDYFKDKINQLLIYEYQEEYIKSGKVFILSSIPPFIFDMKNRKFFKSFVKKTKLNCYLDTK